MALYRTSLTYLNAGTECVNVLYFDNTPGSGDAVELCEKIKTHWFAGPLAAAVGNNTVLTKIVAVEVVRMGEQDAHEVSATLAGLAGSSEAPQLAVAFNIRTGFYGRTRRGRWFQTGFDDGQTTAGKLTAMAQQAATSVVAALTTKWVGDNATSGFRLGVFSRERYKLLSNPFDDYWKPANSIGAASVLSTMRSRKPAS